MSEQQFIEDTEIEAANENVEIPKKKKELSQKQIEHLNNIRVKALEKKREIKLKKNKEYEEKGKKPEVIEQPIIKPPEPEIKPEIKPESSSALNPQRDFNKPALSAAEVKPDVKKKKVIKKVIKYVEQDTDDDEEEQEEIIVTKKKGKKPEVPPPVQVEKSYNDLLCESSLERMQSKIMNERAKHLITHIIPNYY
jgi:hypothetical protein